MPPPPRISPPPPFSPPPVLIMGPREPGPPGPRLLSAVLEPPRWFAAARLVDSPNPNVRVMRRLAVNCEWPMPKLRGIMSLLVFENAGTTPAQRVGNCAQ